MKKRVLLLSAAGIAGGLVYAFENNRSKRRASQEFLRNGESLPNKKRTKISASNRDDSFEQDTSVPQTENGTPFFEIEPHQLDDHGTNQSGASNILKQIRDAAFDASNEKLALALGRPTEEIVQGLKGEALIDGDVVMKARALAMQRGLKIE